MGNNIVITKKTKIMKINGETFKIKLPAKAMDVLKDYPDGYVLLDPESVKRCGIRAQHLLPETELKPKKVYFLVELPKFPVENRPSMRRASFVIHNGSAKERLDWLMVKQKSVSESSSGNGPFRVKMRLPKSQLEKLMSENKDEAVMGDKILDLCLENACNSNEQLEGSRDLKLEDVLYETILN